MTDNEEVIPDKMIKFILNMVEQCGNIKSTANKEADEKPGTEIGTMNLQKANIYSNMQILFGAVSLTMMAINSLAAKGVNRDDLNSLREELTRKVDKTLSPLKEQIAAWNEKNQRNEDMEAYG